jgi:cardiolipin synthase
LAEVRLLAELRDYLPHITTIIFVVDVLIIVTTIPWILIIKKDSTAAMAWCLVVLLVPILGFLLFVLFGYTHVYRPLKKKRRHRARYKAKRGEPEKAGEVVAPEAPIEPTWQDLGAFAMRLGAFPVSPGNEVKLYHDTADKFRDLFEAIREARHHIHLEYFIVRPDETGRGFLDLLTQKAKEKVEVRLLYDAVGTRSLSRRRLRPLREAGGQVRAFLPLDIFRRRVQVNLRNHRKIAVIDGHTAFTGGVNIGDEYLGRDKYLGYWRDTHLRLRGPAAGDLQRVFAEDWDFAAGEDLRGDEYYPDLPPAGESAVQIVGSGPDQEFNSFRDLLFAALTVAREHIWMATPYFVPDPSILDAVRLAARRGVDVRILAPQKPDHWLTHFASGYYFADLIREGVRVYLYTKGMMHAKVMIVDREWGFVGTSNMDYRSLRLNFEVNCVMHSRAVLAELAEVFLKDQCSSLRLEKKTYGARGFLTRLAENACRLLSPVL